MVSLDPSLPDRMIRIRKSMTKFDSTGNTDVEICGIASRPLSLFLNRALIKILEDLGIHSNVFLEMQRQMIESLEKALNQPMLAAKLLSSEHLDLIHMSDLIRNLCAMELSPYSDPFIQSSVDMLALFKLRDLKYRGRIHVKQGVKLYGIMDETGYLKANEIFCSREVDGFNEILVRERVLVTRSPALHPGDVQIVKAVQPPSWSSGNPLNSLINVIVFSQHGVRDIPSMLGGGGKLTMIWPTKLIRSSDLDGDLFDIIWDPSLIPSYLVQPADYPKTQPVDIGRPVVAADIINHFVEFMDNDRVGAISNMHLQLADLKTVHSEECKKLAEMASTAVDYPKTGIR
jgi:hypothetical protein